MERFLFAFACLVLLQSVAYFICQPPAYAHVGIHLACAGMASMHANKRKGKQVDLLMWWSLSILHVLAHVLFPAFLRNFPSKPDSRFNPALDYVIHALQCLCVFRLTDRRKWRMVSIGFAVGLLYAAFKTNMDRSFLDQPLWKLLSIGGVFGTVSQHLLLENSYDMLKVNCLIWIFPYIGYYLHSPQTIWQWDFIMHKVGLFYWWYLTYFLVFSFIKL